MIWNWLKHLFFSYPEKSLSELNEEDRIINEIEQSAEEPEQDIGIVTFINQGLVEINKKWVAHEELFSLKVGSLVSFIKPENPESNVVSHIEEIKNVKPQTNDITAHNYEGVIDFVDEEKILVNPGSLVVWRNDAEVSFSPKKGDCIKLNYSDDDILKLDPKECMIVQDEIKEWDGVCGLLEGQVLISREACDNNFYVPKEGDRVVSSIIPCRGENYQWRALIFSKIESKSYKNDKRLELKCTPFFVVALGGRKVIDLPIKNISLETLRIKNVTITPVLTNVTLLTNSVTKINPGISVTFKILCCGISTGITIFDLSLKFNSFVFNTRVKFLTAEDTPERNLMQGNEVNASSFVNPYKKPNFLRIKPKLYEIPSFITKILEVDGRDVFYYMSLIQEEIPALSQGLTMQNYGLFLHTVLFLEELAQIQMMEELETVAPIIQRGPYYVFTFDEGSAYSQLCPGDIVFLSNPWIEDNQENSAQVKIWSKKETELLLQIKDVFKIISSKGTLFRMKFMSNRTNIIRTHHAIDYFLKRMDVKYLFPSITSKKPYIDTRFNCWDSDMQGHRKYIFKELNEEQREAVQNIVFCNDNYNYPYLIYGPPGTGKTVTLLESALQTIFYFPKSVILFAAHSNSAVDTFCEQLVSSGLLNSKTFLRLTGFNYTQQGQLPVSLLEYSAVANVTGGGQEEIRTCDVDDICRYKVVAGTLNTLGILNCVGLTQGHFSHIFIDEAGQTTEPETLIPLAGMDIWHSRVVLAGDPNQLGPVIYSNIAKKYHLGESMMKRLMSLPIYARFLAPGGSSIKSKIITMLRRNYRSLPSLVNLTSSLFYDNRLIAVLSEQSREAAVLNEIKKTRFGCSGSSLIVVTVNGREEYLRSEGHSYWNSIEAARVSVVVSDLYRIGITAEKIGIITPYTLQAKHIRQCLASLKMEPPKVGTVEEFQGSERDVIIISLVKTTNTDCLSSFINSPRRVNVILSRGKVMNVVVANENTLRTSPIWAQVLNRAEIVS